MTLFDRNTFHTQPRFSQQSWQFNPDSHNCNSMFDYIEWLFSKRSRLLVIRIDLSFMANTQGQCDAEYARDCHRRLLNNSRSNRLFDNMIGYVWSMEYGQDKGFHYHCIFVYDGHLSQKDTWIGDQIGKYWHNTITRGTGHYYCSNGDEARLARQGFPIGVGMVHRSEIDKVENMALMATYLIKDAEDDEPRMRTVLPESLRRFRTFGHGEMR